MRNETLAQRCRGSHDPIGCINSKVSKGQVTTASALEVAGMIIFEFYEFVEVDVHRIGLVPRSRKVDREAASGEARPDLGVASSAADDGDIGTCKTMAVW